MNSKKQDLARLAVGDRVKVRLNDGTKVTGVLSSLTDGEPARLHITLPRGRLVVRGLGNTRGPGVKSVRPAPSSKTPQPLPVEGRSAWDVLRFCGVSFTGSRDAESCAHANTEGGRIVVREGDEVIASAGTFRCVDCGMISSRPLTVPATDELATGPKLIRTVIKL